MSFPTKSPNAFNDGAISAPRAAISSVIRKAHDKRIDRARRPYQRGKAAFGQAVAASHGGQFEYLAFRREREVRFDIDDGITFRKSVKTFSFERTAIGIFHSAFSSMYLRL